MQSLLDYQGRIVRLTEERLAHIVEHQEMRGMESALVETVRNPTFVIASRSDPFAEMAYRFYARTTVGDNWLCVVVKYALNDAFVLTAYPHRQTKERRADMAHKVKVWFDKEGDFLEVTFAERAGYMRETANDAVMERLDESGQIIGFSILQVSRLAADRPLEAELVALR